MSAEGSSSVAASEQKRIFRTVTHQEHLKRAFPYAIDSIKYEECSSQEGRIPFSTDLMTSARLKV